jgi:hypothetical protein
VPFKQSPLSGCRFAHPYPYSHACWGDSPTDARKQSWPATRSPPLGPAYDVVYGRFSMRDAILIVGGSMRRVLRGDSIGCERRTARTRATGAGVGNGGVVP